jgi:hypothetical protein
MLLARGLPALTPQLRLYARAEKLQQALLLAAQRLPAFLYAGRRNVLGSAVIFMASRIDFLRHVTANYDHGDRCEYCR